MDWSAIIMFPAMVILLVAFYPAIDIVVVLLFNTIDSSTTIAYGNMIKLLVGMTGLLLALGLLYSIVQAVKRQPNEPTAQW